MTELNENENLIEELVLRVQAGDKDAFSKLYDLFVDPLYRYVYFRVDKNDGEDILEQVFLKIWENIGKYKNTKNSKFSSWAFRIAHNLIVDYYRTKKIKDYSELSIDLPSMDREHNPIKKTEEKINVVILKKAMVSLKKHYREFLVLKFINELDNKEIADLLEKSEGGIRILQMRSLKALKKALEGFGVDFKSF